MPFDFSKIDQTVNDTLSTQAPAAQPTEEQKPAPATTDYQSDLARANAEIQRLQAEHASEKAEQEARMADLRIKMAATAAHKPTQHVGIGQQDAQLEKIIRECGGRAYFEKLTPSEKSTAMGYAGSDSIKDAEAFASSEKTPIAKPPSGWPTLIPLPTED